MKQISQIFYLGWLRKISRRYCRDRQGVTAIEFAIVGPPFFLLVIGIIELGLAFFVNRMVDNAVLESSRLIRTGQAQSFDAASFKTSICDGLPTGFCQPERIVLSVEKIDSFSNSANDLKEPLVDENGDPLDDYYEVTAAEDIVAVRVMYRWPMFSALLQTSPGDSGTERQLYSTFIFRNEPWQGSG
ncbi:pilus biosynthesis protein TadE [Roseibium aquae]|uniref:Pilus biosynthesis protein TadE n=1 Tax=Roseibium aquae TaxID=1323746 RepID=A0A916TMH7_9HYPH|nr:TadE/TadG family type IV pilus assembly protein [Roseibium aquae]GGB57387.1 pilus biosynthesis protein TadE [Roseibium aquae]